MIQKEFPMKKCRPGLCRICRIYDNDFDYGYNYDCWDDKLGNNWSGFSAQAIVLRIAKPTQCTLFSNDSFLFMHG